MKINRLETHDRLLEFNKQADYISQGCQDCIKNRPPEYGDFPFYIFAHKREIGMDERIDLFYKDIDTALLLCGKRKYSYFENVPTHRLLWEPRLSKPKAQSNSMLFRVHPASDIIKIIWILPAEELWAQYRKGNMTEHQIVWESIDKFLKDRKTLEGDEPDELADSVKIGIMAEIGRNARKSLKQPTSAASSIVLE